MPSDHDQLLHALFASAAEVPAWESFTRLARDILHCDQVAVLIDSADGTPPVGTFADGHAADAINALLCQDADTPHKAGIRMCADDNGAALILSVSGGHTRGASIALWQAGGAAQFPASTRKALEGLTRPLQTCLTIFYRLVEHARQRALSDVALETSRIGVALVGEDGEVLIANSVTEQFLASKDGLLLINGKLRADNPDQTQALLDEIRRCALDQQPEINTGVYRPLAFSRRNQALPLTAVVRPGPGYSPMPRPLRRTAILVLRDPAQQAPWPAQALAQLFGFSPAEANLASELARGASIDEASATLGVSRNTARTQLKSIFLKTGLNRQSDLIRALLNSGASST